MKALSRFIVKVADLAEAEGRVLRREAIGVGLILVTALGALLLGIAGFAMIVLATFLALRPELGPAWSAAACAVLLFAGAGGLIWLVKDRHDR